MTTRYYYLALLEIPYLQFSSSLKSGVEVYHPPQLSLLHCSLLSVLCDFNRAPYFFSVHSLTMETTDGIEVLAKGIGYGIAIGIGAFFAFLMYLTLPPSSNPLTNSPGLQ